MPLATSSRSLNRSPGIRWPECSSILSSTSPDGHMLDHVSLKVTGAHCSPPNPAAVFSARRHGWLLTEAVTAPPACQMLFGLNPVSAKIHHLSVKLESMAQKANKAALRDEAAGFPFVFRRSPAAGGAGPRRGPTPPPGGRGRGSRGRQGALGDRPRLVPGAPPRPAPARWEAYKYVLFTYIYKSALAGGKEKGEARLKPLGCPGHLRARSARPLTLPPAPRCHLVQPAEAGSVAEGKHTEYPSGKLAGENLRKHLGARVGAPVTEPLSVRRREMGCGWLQGSGTLSYTFRTVKELRDQKCGGFQSKCLRRSPHKRPPGSKDRKPWQLRVLGADLHRGARRGIWNRLGAHKVFLGWVEQR